MPGAVYSPFADRIATHPGPIFPLHVGDTWMEPFEGGRMQDLSVDDYPGMHRYCDTRGIPELIDALVEKVRGRNGLAVEPESLLVTGGATGALATVVGALVDPGEEVLILAPFWPLIRGVVTTFRGVPVEVPFYGLVDNAEAAVEAIADWAPASAKVEGTPRHAFRPWPRWRRPEPGAPEQCRCPSRPSSAEVLANLRPPRVPGTQAAERAGRPTETAAHSRSTSTPPPRVGTEASCLRSRRRPAGSTRVDHEVGAG